MSFLNNNFLDLVNFACNLYSKIMTIILEGLLDFRFEINELISFEEE